MDRIDFDRVAAVFAQAQDRRGVLRLLGAAIASGGTVTVLASTEIDVKAKKKKHRKPTCKDGRKNGSETDVDCGGSCPRCKVTKTCQNRDDCVTALCEGGVCIEPENATDCGLDAGGGNCATRVNSDNVRICTKINGRFFLDGTCQDRCRGEEQCVLPVSGGVECVLPCGVAA
ncbi:MAG: hypothetical protein U0031_07145 [Thermomicrobiales bacterium]